MRHKLWYFIFSWTFQLSPYQTKICSVVCGEIRKKCYWSAQSQMLFLVNNIRSSWNLDLSLSFLNFLPENKVVVNYTDYSFVVDWASNISLARVVISPSSLSTRGVTSLSWVLLVERISSTASLDRFWRLERLPACLVRRESRRIILC